MQRFDQEIKNGSGNADRHFLIIFIGGGGESGIASALHDENFPGFDLCLHPVEQEGGGSFYDELQRDADIPVMPHLMTSPPFAVNKRIGIQNRAAMRSVIPSEVLDLTVSPYLGFVIRRAIRCDSFHDSMFLIKNSMFSRFLSIDIFYKIIYNNRKTTRERKES